MFFGFFMIFVVILIVLCICVVIYSGDIKIEKIIQKFKKYKTVFDDKKKFKKAKNEQIKFVSAQTNLNRYSIKDRKNNKIFNDFIKEEQIFSKEELEKIVKIISNADIVSKYSNNWHFHLYMILLNKIISPLDITKVI